MAARNHADTGPPQHLRMDKRHFSGPWPEIGIASRVVALHSSAAGARQWQAYSSLIDPRCQWQALDLLGYEAGASWPIGGKTSLDAEAQRIVPWLGGDREPPVHLVGHSYGGAVALQLALICPERLASVTVYEPVRFALLRATDVTKWHEIVRVGRRIGALVLAGHSMEAAKRFVDYWSGEGAWDRLAATRQQGVALRMPKVQAEFEALFGDRVTASAYRALRMPVRVVRGTRSPEPVRRVAECLVDACLQVELLSLTGADHMTPLTHPERFAATLPCAQAQVARDAA
jgi:pimeloyl-ACP methyl ester carboxylesterase